MMNMLGDKMMVKVDVNRRWSLLQGYPVNVVDESRHIRLRSSFPHAGALGKDLNVSPSRGGGKGAGMLGCTQTVVSVLGREPKKVEQDLMISETVLRGCCREEYLVDSSRRVLFFLELLGISGGHPH
jgi:hypothetical protein